MKIKNKIKSWHKQPHWGWLHYTHARRDRGSACSRKEGARRGHDRPWCQILPDHLSIWHM